MAIDDLTPLEKDIEYMADAVVQVYKTIADYRDGEYPQLNFDPQRTVYPMVVTLERWHLFGPALIGLLHRSVCIKLEAVGISVNCLEEMPFSIWHVSELERGMQIINRVGIHDFMAGKLNDPEMRDWEWPSYMRSRFAGYKNEQLFADEYDAVFRPIGL